MKKFEEFIVECSGIYDLIKEERYKGNLGLMELFKFYPVATDDQKKKMNDIVSMEDDPDDPKKRWNAFRTLIKEVLNIDLEE